MATITTLDIVALMAKEKKPICPSDLRTKNGLDIDKAFASRFVEPLNKKFLKKVARPKNSKARADAPFYVITALGLKYLAANKADVQSVEQIKKNLQNRPARGSKDDVFIPMNGKANAAIDSISKLMDDYNHANQMLKQIHAMIGNYLANNQGETANEQKQS